MKPWKTLDRAPSPGGGELVLQQRGDEFVIRVDGRELMSSRTHGSEEAMARLAREKLGKVSRPRVLVGGLGLGYTLRATLERFPSETEVVVAELSPAVVAWNRGPLAPLAGAPLEDSRVRVEEVDVLKLVSKAPDAFDAILLDVDNGPVSVTRPGSGSLYNEHGIAAFHRALTPRGVLIVWSAGPDERYEARLGRAGFSVSLAHHGEHGRSHTLFVAQRRSAASPRRGAR